jgi:phosphoacetylglucosamine mutase
MANICLGIKVVEPEGCCVSDAAFEKLAEEFVNASEDDFISLVESVSKTGGQLAANGDSAGLVIVGRDTRVSSERLSKCVIRGAVKVGAHFEDYGIVHTPLVHHLVRMINGHDNVAWASQLKKNSLHFQVDREMRAKIM